MKFLADMGISQTTIKWLLREGHDPVHVRDLNLISAADEAIIKIARQKGYTVFPVTLILAILWLLPVMCPGYYYLQTRKQQA